MFIKTYSAANLGLETIGVDVEINISSRGLPVFEIIGLPSKSIEESKKRIRAAILNSRFEFPSKRIIVNLAPADIPKQGSCYDLPIAIGILALTSGLNIPSKYLFFGELSLDGTLRHTRGALLLSLFAKEKGIKNIFVPSDSANEASCVKGVNIFGAKDINQVFAHLKGEEQINPAVYSGREKKSKQAVSEFDMADILGQEQAKRALEISATGGHNVFLLGSPGSGKTMLARALPGILPLLSEKESLEVAKIYSSSGKIPPRGSLITTRPFRAPHHTTSQAGLVGGGTIPAPGEISLAHRGVLFLDEFFEFPRHIIESLRQPIEDGFLSISRSKARIEYPARFMLIASANPCPCGYLLHPQRPCNCTEREIKKYRKRISGPILDRIDLHVDVSIVNPEDFSRFEKTEENEKSEEIRSRVAEARKIQKQRFLKDNIFANAEMNNNQIKSYCPLSKEAKIILDRAAANFYLSARSYFKTIKIARTISDLEKTLNIEANHIAEALQYRLKEQEN